MTVTNVFTFSNHRLTKEVKSVAAVIRTFQIISAPSANILLRSTRIHSIVTNVASVGGWYILDFRSKDVYLHFLFPSSRHIAFFNIDLITVRIWAARIKQCITPQRWVHPHSLQKLPFVFFSRYEWRENTLLPKQGPYVALIFLFSSQSCSPKNKGN